MQEVNDSVIRHLSQEQVSSLHLKHYCTYILVRCAKIILCLYASLYACGSPSLDATSQLVSLGFSLGEVFHISAADVFLIFGRRLNPNFFITFRAVASSRHSKIRQ